MFIKLLFLVIFFVIMIVIGIYCRKHANNVNSFVLGGRSVGPWLTAFSYGTSYFSAVIFVGYAGQFGWKYGIAATWIGIGNAVIGSLLAWKILAGRTRTMTKHLDSATMPEFFSKRFNSKSLKVFASSICFIFLVPYTASLYNGLSRIFEMAFNIDYIYCVLGMSILTAIYVVLGGYMATAINDLIQGVIMLFGIVAVIFAVLNNNGGFTKSIISLSEIRGETAQQGVYTSFFGPDLISLISVILLTSLGTWGLPQMVQKFYAIRSENAVKKATIVSTIFAFVVAGGCYFLGGFGRLYSNVVEYSGDKLIYDSIVPKMLESLPDILIGIVVVLVLSASMSTLSALVLTSSSTLTLDFIAPLKRKEMSEKTKLVSMKIFIVFFIAVSATIAIIQSNSTVTFIAQLMGISWGALAGAFLAPFIYSLYWKGTTKAAVVVNIFIGSSVMILNLLCNNIFPEVLKSPINTGVLTMLLGFITVPVVSVVTKKLEKSKIEEIFSCLNN